MFAVAFYSMYIMYREVSYAMFLVFRLDRSTDVLFSCCRGFER